MRRIAVVIILIFGLTAEGLCLRPAASGCARTAAASVRQQKVTRETLLSLGLKPRPGHEEERFLASLKAVLAIKEPVMATFVIPMYKEKDRLMPKSGSNPDGEDSLREKVKQWEALSEQNPFFHWQIITVDDGSPGASSDICVKKIWQEIVEEYGGKIEKEQLIPLAITPQDKARFKSRKGFAVLLGLQKARELAKKTPGFIHFAGYIDADKSSPPFQTALLIKPLYNREAGVAIASRWCKEGMAEGVPLSGRISSKVYNWSVRFMLWPFLKGVQDTQRGFKLFSIEALDDILDFVKEHGWAFDTELLVLARLAGYDIKEVGIAWFDSPKASKLHMLRDAPKMFLSLIRQKARVLLYKIFGNGPKKGRIKDRPSGYLDIMADIARPELPACSALGSLPDRLDRQNILLRLDRAA